MASNQEVVHRGTNYGMLYMLMGSTCMALMNIGAKFIKLTSKVSVLQIGLIRGLIQAVGCFIHAKVSGVDVT